MPARHGHIACWCQGLKRFAINDCIVGKTIAGDDKLDYVYLLPIT